MNSILRYELTARIFQIMTGQLAPGKDAAPESYPAPIEERMELWRVWLKDNREILRAMEIATDDFFGEKSDIYE